MSIDKKIEDYLKEDEDILEEEDTEFFDDSEVMDRMFEFITNMEVDNLTEEQASELVDILDEIAGKEIEEGISAKRVKIDPKEKRKRKREYRKKKAKLKMKARKFRRTAKYKRYKRKKERKAKSGKTATGKRIRKFI
jgi:hypothetical protein